jgi:hypothetical protein
VDRRSLSCRVPPLDRRRWCRRQIGLGRDPDREAALRPGQRLGERSHAPPLRLSALGRDARIARSTRPAMRRSQRSSSCWRLAKGSASRPKALANGRFSERRRRRPSSMQDLVAREARRRRSRRRASPGGSRYEATSRGRTGDVGTFLRSERRAARRGGAPAWRRSPYGPERPRRCGRGRQCVPSAASGDGRDRAEEPVRLLVGTRRQPPPQGPLRGRPARAREARHMGVLPASAVAAREFVGWKGLVAAIDALLCGDAMGGAADSRGRAMEERRGKPCRQVRRRPRVSQVRADECRQPRGEHLDALRLATERQNSNTHPNQRPHLRIHNGYTAQRS